MSKGYVYILTNPSMPGLVKIGKTTRDPESRAHELYQTGVPTPFVVHGSFKTPDCDWLEISLHREFAEVRVNDSREFFQMSADVACWVAEAGVKEQLAVLVSDYLLDHIVVHRDLTPDQRELDKISERIGVHPAELSSAISCMDDGVARSLFSAWKAKITGRKSTNLKVVGDQ